MLTKLDFTEIILSFIKIIFEPTFSSFIKYLDIFVLFRSFLKLYLILKFRCFSIYLNEFKKNFKDTRNFVTLRTSLKTLFIKILVKWHKLFLSCKFGIDILSLDKNILWIKAMKWYRLNLRHLCLTRLLW